jgi:hypothetical protein
MEQAQLACGIRTLIEHADEPYVKERGRMAVAPGLPPAHLSEFDEGAASDITVLHGISVIPNQRVDRPVPIDERSNPFER